MKNLLSDANKKYVNGNYKEAIKIYTKFLEVNPNSIEALLFRGMAFHDLGKYKEAISDYSKVILLDKNNASAYKNRALSYYCLNDNFAALADYNEATRLTSK